MYWWYSLSFLSGLMSYFDNDLCLTKVKIDDKLKTIAFDAKNRRLVVASYDRVLYYMDLPQNPTRYITSVEVRFF